MEILQRALGEALDRNAAETVRWTRYKEQHEEAKTNIQEFTKSLEVDIMVPIGTKALMPGRLYHTNEILVSHSGTYYSKCSAHKALEICQKRLNTATHRLIDLEAEANLHRNQMEFPHDFDAFSSREIIEAYDDEKEKQWQAEHKIRMKEHKLREAAERQKLLNSVDEDDINKRLEELELLEELEKELEVIAEEDEEAVNAILNENVEQTPHKKRISHLNEHINANASSSGENTIIFKSLLSSDEDEDDDDDDDDDVPPEFKEIERKSTSMTIKEKLKLFESKLAEVQNYLEGSRPCSLEEFSYKTDKMFLADHLLNAIERIKDELNCNQYLNGDNAMDEGSDDNMLPAVVPKTILKKENSKSTDTKRISFDLNHEIRSYNIDDPSTKLSPMKQITFAEEDDDRDFHMEDTDRISTNVFFDQRSSLNSNISHSEAVFDKSREKLDVIDQSTKQVSFATEVEVKEFHGTIDNSTVIFHNAPVPNLNVNHSDAVFTKSTEKSDVIRSPADIYTEFAACTLYESNNRKLKSCLKNASNEPQREKFMDEPIDKDVTEAKTEVKEMLDNMFGNRNANEPDPLPDGNFVDAHEPKKRISLFKQRRQMKKQ